jgi:aminoglycoside 3-N-acetyltransferase
MSEEAIIARTKEPVTIDSLCGDFQKLGIREGDTVLVHSSLSSVGWVCGGPQAVAMALLRALGESGTLVMPAHSGDVSDPAEWQNPPVPKEWIQAIYDNMPAYEPQKTPTRGMGRIAELFRSFPGTLRSGNPLLSFSANGRHAAHITENHPLTPQLGMGSPLGKLYELDAKVLLLGVGYGSCTSFHLSEALCPEMPVKRNGSAMIEDSKRIWKWFDDFAYDSDDFEEIGADFEKAHEVRHGKAGYADCSLFGIRAGVDFAKTWLQTHRFK